MAATLLLLAGPLGARSACAQTSGPAGPLTLEEAEALFLANSPGLRAQRADAQERTYEARVPALWPNPSADLEQERGFDDAQQTYLLSQPVPNLWAYRAQRQVTGATVRQARAAFREEASALLFELRQRYALAATAQARLAVLDSLTQAVRRAVGAGQVRFDEGAINSFEVQRLRLAQANYENERIDAQASYRIARAALARLLVPDGAAAEPGTARFTVADPLAYEPASTADYAVLLEQALRQRGRIDSARAAAQASRFALRRERASRVPGISVVGGYTRAPGVGTRGAVIGLGIEVPLFHRNGLQVQAAQARRQGATFVLDAARRAVAQDVRAAYVQLISFEARIDSLEATRPQPVRSFLSDALYLYSEGQLTLVELLDAIGAARDARLLRIELLSGHQQARFALTRAVGTLPSELAAFSDPD